jgi:hypothetical protein
MLLTPPNRAGKTPLLILLLAGITLATISCHFLPREEDTDRGAMEEVEVEEEAEAEEVEVTGGGRLSQHAIPSCGWSPGGTASHWTSSFHPVPLNGPSYQT